MSNADLSLWLLWLELVTTALRQRCLMQVHGCKQVWPPLCPSWQQVPLRLYMRTLSQHRKLSSCALQLTANLLCVTNNL